MKNINKTIDKILKGLSGKHINVFLIPLVVIIPLLGSPKADAAALFSDVSSNNESSLSFFQTQRSMGVKGTVVKLTEGTGYQSPVASTQINNARAVGMKVNFYHYARFYNQPQAISEADTFVAVAKSKGYQPSSNATMVLDIEEPSLRGTNTAGNSDAFLSRVQSYGYKVALYSSASWWQEGRLSRNFPMWVAAYNPYGSGINGATAWQFTSGFNGLHLDASYDYTGLFTGNQSATKPTAPAQPAQSYTAQSGTYTVSTRTNIRNGLNGAITGYYNPRMSFRYDRIYHNVFINGAKYDVLSYINYAGTRSYVAKIGSAPVQAQSYTSQSGTYTVSTRTNIRNGLNGAINGYYNPGMSFRYDRIYHNVSINGAKYDVLSYINYSGTRSYVAKISYAQAQSSKAAYGRYTVKQYTNIRNGLNGAIVGHYNPGMSFNYDRLYYNVNINGVSYTVASYVNYSGTRSYVALI